MTSVNSQHHGFVALKRADTSAFIDNPFKIRSRVTKIDFENEICNLFYFTSSDDDLKTYSNITYMPQKVVRKIYFPTEHDIDA